MTYQSMSGGCMVEQFRAVVKNGEISIIKAEKWNQELKKALKMAYPLSPAHYDSDEAFKDFLKNTK